MTADGETGAGPGQAGPGQGVNPEWSGLRVVVAGIGVSGFAAADALLERGARVVVVDPRTERAQHERGIVLETLGARILLGRGRDEGLPEVDGGPAQLLVVSPGWDDGTPLVREALAAGLPVWGEAELAWRLRPAVGAAPWLAVTGTRGKATTTTMLATMLAAAGHRTTAAGLAGTSLLESVLHPSPYDVLAVQLSAFQLRWSSSLSPLASVCLNVTGDDLEGEGRAVRGRVYENTQVACVYNVADPVTEQLVRDADVIEGCRAIGFTLGVPAVSMLGLVEDVLCDRAFVPQRVTSAAELGTLEDVRTAGAGILAAHLTADALAAAALARAFGVTPAAVRTGLREYLPLPHRLNPVGSGPGEVSWVDDVAAVDAASASAGLSAFEHVVWLAGGAGDDEALAQVVETHAARLRAVVLLGPAGDALRAALRRHAPDVPVEEVPAGETGAVAVMEDAVRAAEGYAHPGDTVLLSPGCDLSEPGTVAEIGTLADIGTLAEIGTAFARAVPTA